MATALVGKRPLMPALIQGKSARITELRRARTPQEGCNPTMWSRPKELERRGHDARRSCQNAPVGVVQTGSRSWRLVSRAVPVLVFGFLTVVAVVNIDHGNPSRLALVGRSAYALLLVFQVAAFATQPAPHARDGRAPVWIVTRAATFGATVGARPQVPLG